jgi:hypothetical protein
MCFYGIVTIQSIRASQRREKQEDSITHVFFPLSTPIDVNKVQDRELDSMAHAYNPSYSGGAQFEASPDKNLLVVRS